MTAVAEHTITLASGLNRRKQMPVTAKLSKRFYEQFGDELTNELVEWFNSVDATYHSDLRELNEINFARFDAKLEQRAAAIEGKIESLKGQLDRRIDALESKMDSRFAASDHRIGALESTMDTRFAASETAADHRIGVLDTRLEKRFAVFEARIYRWTLTLWTGTMLAFASLLVAVLRSK
jgi:hypothetical protein